MINHYLECRQENVELRQKVLDDNDGEPEKTNIRLIVSTGKRDNTYTPTKLIVKKQDEYEALLFDNPALLEGGTE